MSTPDDDVYSLDWSTDGIKQLQDEKPLYRVIKNLLDYGPSLTDMSHSYEKTNVFEAAYCYLNYM